MAMGFGLRFQGAGWQPGTVKGQQGRYRNKPSGLFLIYVYTIRWQYRSGQL
ncbi:uncharacterized protein TrAFT101_001443 [Trichoderma asperellum]|uniref:uncharacterized protein n=1 Tax=Trichoderma asperellum TaxID=101201 RepID=UPI0033335DA2|nr:hypothetical protein TrAFT101_001443 [Trichoderma asperellum]